MNCTLRYTLEFVVTDHVQGSVVKSTAIVDLRTLSTADVRDSFFIVLDAGPHKLIRELRVSTIYGIFGKYFTRLVSIVE